MKVAIVVSANVEWRAVLAVLAGQQFELGEYPYGQCFALDVGGRTAQFYHGGWGKVSAAASAQYILDQCEPDLLINLGTCGGFEGRIETGTVMLVERTIIYDILEQMGDSQAAVRHYVADLDLSWVPQPYPHPVRRGLLVSADRDLVVGDIPGLIESYDAVAADWESGAIAWVAQRNRTRVLILRAVSDLVGSEGGEAYGNIGLFEERTRTVMGELLRQLPDWLSHVSGSFPPPNS
jgi:adenosylhomocysteine nucleosidase